MLNPYPPIRSEPDTAVLDGWNDIVLRHSNSVLDLDVTATADWARVLAQVFLNGKLDCNVVLADAQGVSAVLPLFVRTVSVGRVPLRCLSPITECYSGRCGFILRDPEFGSLEQLMEVLFRELGDGWDIFTITLVDGSPSQQLFQELLRRRGWAHARSSPIASPYTELRGDWDQYFSTINGEFRSNLRKRERRFRAAGNYTFDVIEGVREGESFLEAMFEVERESWKQSAGSSVTTNDYQERVYRALVPVAAARGWLRAHLLRLNGEPVGHLLGLLYNGIFYNLKHSYKEKFKDFSIGNLVQMLAMQALYERRASFFDHMGTCERHKMVWANGTYSRSTYTLYNRTPRGRLLKYGRRLRGLLRR